MKFIKLTEETANVDAPTTYLNLAQVTHVEVAAKATGTELTVYLPNGSVFDIWGEAEVATILDAIA